MASTVNLALVRIAKRAERQDDATLAKTFVDYGAVIASLSALDHHIIVGRRGTGKTHLLTVLRKMQEDSGVVSLQIDMRNLGSTGGVYADPTIPKAQRATRLLIDVLSNIHNTLLEQAIKDDTIIDLSSISSSLDGFFDSHRSVKVVGTTTIETSTSAESSSGAEEKLGVSVELKSPTLSGQFQLSDSSKESVTAKKVVVGEEILRVNFGNVGASLRKVVEALPQQQLWLLIDEWSEIPLDLQPILADLLRRAILPIRGVTVKIAAIEQRSRFLIPDQSVGHIGIELGADISAAVNLDDFMVFDNDSQKAVEFFKTLLYKHARAELESLYEAAIRQAKVKATIAADAKLRISGQDTFSQKLMAEEDCAVKELAAKEADEKIKITANSIPKSEQAFISTSFTQANAFDEIVRACEGVPRDAINILSAAAQRANDKLISVADIRLAAQNWYLGSKDAAVSARDDAKELLTWIVDKVIKEKQAKAFLLESGTRDYLIDFLYDERVLHVLRKGISSKDQPGKRFTVYGIDYGCYVDLISTAKAPQFVLDIGEDEEEKIINVPQTDLRSIRRCVLDLPEFYRNYVQATPRNL